MPGVAAPCLPITTPFDLPVGNSFEGRVLGGTYRVLRQIGRGAMGIIYEAQHLRLYRRVAIKVLPSQLAGRPELRARFEHEADMVSSIRSQHVVDILDYDVTELGEPYLVLELLEGETLAARLVREPRLSVSECGVLVRQIALGLSAAHRANVVHRDLKPDNVFLVADPDEAVFVKLLDFGIGKSLGPGSHITAERMILGTPGYMSPEQALGNDHQIDSRTDQHALAVLAYEMLTGSHPFEGDGLADTLRRVVALTPEPASALDRRIPRAADAVLERALSKDPVSRYDDVAEFSRALEDALDEKAEGLEDPDIDGVGAEIPEDVLLSRLGSVFAVLTRVSTAAEWRRVSMSSRTAFLLSRLEQGMTLATALDVAAMPRLEALRRLAALVARGHVSLGGDFP